MDGCRLSASSSRILYYGTIGIYSSNGCGSTGLEKERCKELIYKHNKQKYMFAGTKTRRREDRNGWKGVKTGMERVHVHVSDLNHFD